MMRKRLTFSTQPKGLSASSACVAILTLLSLVSFACSIAALVVAVQARTDSSSALSRPVAPPVAPVAPVLPSLYVGAGVPNATLSAEYTWYQDNQTGIVYVRLTNTTYATFAARTSTGRQRRAADLVPTDAVAPTESLQSEITGDIIQGSTVVASAQPPETTTPWFPINQRSTPVVVLAPYRGLAPYVNGSFWYYTNNSQSNAAFAGAPQLISGTLSELGLLPNQTLVSVVSGSTSSSDGFVSARPVSSLRLYFNAQFASQSAARRIQTFITLNNTVVNFGWGNIAGGTADLRAQVVVEWGGVPANTAIRAHVTGTFTSTPTNANVYFVLHY